MKNFVPNVTNADVERVLRRDFSNEDVDRATSLFDTYGRERWHAEKPRVLLACLKLADGDLRELQKQISVACSDFREVLAAAEYPGVYEIGFSGIKRLVDSNPAALDEIQQRDWDQYQEWFNRESSDSN